MGFSKPTVVRNMTADLFFEGHDEEAKEDQHDSSLEQEETKESPEEQDSSKKLWVELEGLLEKDHRTA